MTPLQPRTYFCIWSDETFIHGGDEVKTADFFTEQNMYDPDEIRDILDLAVGETWVSPDYGLAHTVRRLT